MSSLAFDKQARPFKFHARARHLLVREFNNPGARGTCANCYDDDGELLYVDAAITYVEFAKLVGEGFFRLNQCDENHVEIDEKEAPPAYVTVRARTRTMGASGGDGIDPRDAVILNLTQSNQELARTNADIAKAALAQHAAVMAAAANLMREYTAAPPPPRISVMEAPHSDDDDDDHGRDEGRDDDDDQADDHAPAAVPGWMPIYQDVKPHLPAIGGFLYAKIMEVLRSKTASSAAAPTPAAGSNADADASSAPSTGSAPNGAAAGPSAPSASSSNTSEPNASAPGASSPTSSTNSSTATSATPNAATSTENAHGTTPSAEPAATAPDGAPRNAPAVSPTPAEMMRLLEIRSKLTPAEIAIAEHAIKRMSSDVLAQWLANLTARPVDDAVRTVRSMISQAREQHVRG